MVFVVVVDVVVVATVDFVSHTFADIVSCSLLPLFLRSVTAVVLLRR